MVLGSQEAFGRPIETGREATAKELPSAQIGDRFAGAKKKKKSVKLTPKGKNFLLNKAKALSDLGDQHVHQQQWHSNTVCP